MNRILVLVCLTLGFSIPSSAFVVNQVDEGKSERFSILDVVRVAVTKHELSILQRAYLLDTIGEALPDNFVTADFARHRLVTNGRDPALDLWGQPYQIDVETSGVEFWSSGPDGTTDTDDDIVVYLPLT